MTLEHHMKTIHDEDFLNDPNAMKKLALMTGIDLESAYQGNPKLMSTEDYDNLMLELSNEEVIL